VNVGPLQAAIRDSHAAELRNDISMRGKYAKDEERST
jgi:hypothetical protein